MDDVILAKQIKLIMATNILMSDDAVGNFFTSGVLEGFKSLGFGLGKFAVGTMISGAFGPEVAFALGLTNRDPKLDVMDRKLDKLLQASESIQLQLDTVTASQLADQRRQMKAKTDALWEVIAPICGLAHGERKDKGKAKANAKTMLDFLQPGNPAQGVSARARNLWSFVFDEEFPVPTSSSGSMAVNHGVKPGLGSFSSGFLRDYCEALMKSGVRIEELFQVINNVVVGLPVLFALMAKVMAEAREVVKNSQDEENLAALDAMDLPETWFDHQQMACITAEAAARAYAMWPELTRLYFQAHDGGAKVGLSNFALGRMLEGAPGRMPSTREDFFGRLYKNLKPLYGDYSADQLSSLDRADDANRHRLWKIRLVDGASSSAVLGLAASFPYERNWFREEMTPPPPGAQRNVVRTETVQVEPWVRRVSVRVDGPSPRDVAEVAFDSDFIGWDAVDPSSPRKGPPPIEPDKSKWTDYAPEALWTLWVRMTDKGEICLVFANLKDRKGLELNVDKPSSESRHVFADNDPVAERFSRGQQYWRWRFPKQ